MSAAYKTQLSSYQILARSTIHQHDLVLCKHKTSNDFMTAEIDHKNNKLTEIKKHKTTSMAYQDYFIRLAAPLNLDRQSLSLLLITPEITVQDTKCSPAKQNRTKDHIQQGSTPNIPDNRHLIPDTFYTQNNLPIWLEAAKSIRLLSSDTQIQAGEQFKILAMQLIPNAKETESTIHLQSTQGKRIDISLSVACSCFLRSYPPDLQHNHH